MNQDYNPIGPATPTVEVQEAAAGRSSSWKKGLLVGCGGCAVIAVLGAIIGGWALVRFGLNVYADEVEGELRNNPVIVEHVGRIEEFELDLGASIATEDEDEFIFRIRGTKGSGLVTAICLTTADGSEEVASGTIQLESGETLDLFPPDEPEADLPE